MRRPLVVVAAVAVVTVAAGGVFGYAFLLNGSATPTTAMMAPRFVDETATAGVDLTYDGGVAYSVGGGVAAFDCNDDGRPDLFVPGGETSAAALYGNESPTGGALKFTRLAATGAEVTHALGAYPIDFDGDGIVDLAVLRVGGLSLLRGTGNCHFTEAGASLGVADSGYDTAFSAKWDLGAKLPTLAIGRYRKVDAGGNLTLDCDDNLLFRPNVDGTSYAPAITLSPGFCSLSMLFDDWDRSGRRDLRVTNDHNYYAEGSDQLWRVAPGVDPTLYTADNGWVALQVDGMGIGTYDVTGDGYPDYYITSQGDNKLQTLTSGASQPMYRDVAGKRGVTAARPFTGGDVRPSTAWHAEFEDVNNDGFIDLYVAKGNVSEQPDYATRDPSDLFIGQADGTFQEGADAAGILNFARGRGAALADFNLDGLPDLVECNYGAPTKVWRNVGSGDASKAVSEGHWLDVRLSDLGTNRNAIGAWVEVQAGDATLRREINIGGGHVGGQLGWVHFGLGPAASAKVRVIWPDGTQGAWASVSANAFYEIRRGVSEPSLWQPPT